VEAVSALAGRVRALTALESRDFRLLWSGQTISLIGDGAFYVALGWKATSLTGSASSLGVVLMASGIAMLATLMIGGALADRYSRRLLMIASDVARFFVIGALALADATGNLTFPLLIVLAIGFGAADGFFYPAVGGIVPLVVEEAALPSANSLISLSRQLGFLIGPAFAGLVYSASGSAVVFGFNAVSFLVSAGLIALARPRPYQPEPREGTLREIATGIRYVAGIPWLWISIVLAAFILMIAMAPYQTVLPKLVEDHFGRGVGAYGTLWAIQGGGMALGTLLFGQFPPKRHRVVWMYVPFGLNALCVVVMASVASYEAAMGLVLVRGVLIGFGIGVWNTLLMQMVPESKLSRVMSLDFFGSFALVPVGYALAAVAVGFLAPSTILVAGFSLAAVLWVAPLALRPVRTAA
jgi:MFS family permease